jgi:hypothetical protein
MRGVFRLREAIVAIPLSSEQGLTIFTVPTGAILELTGELQKSGLVEVLWDGMHIEVFMRDIESRGDSIKAATAGA